MVKGMSLKGRHGKPLSNSSSSASCALTQAQKEVAVVHANRRFCSSHCSKARVPCSFPPLLLLFLILSTCARISADWKVRGGEAGDLLSQGKRTQATKGEKRRRRRRRGEGKRKEQKPSFSINTAKVFREKIFLLLFILILLQEVTGKREKTVTEPGPKTRIYATRKQIPHS